MYGHFSVHSKSVKTFYPSGMKPYRLSMDSKTLNSITQQNTNYMLKFVSFATNVKLWFCFCQTLFYLEHLRFGPAGGNSKGDVDHGPIAHRPDCHTFSWRVRPPSGRQGSAAARWRPGWRDICR